MFLVTNRVPVAPGWEERFEQRFLDRLGQVEKTPGFVRMDILQPQSEDTPYVVQTLWRDEAAFRAWVGSPDFITAHANPLPKEAYQGEGTMEQFNVVITAVAE